MEKRVMAYDLEAIKLAFLSVEKLRVYRYSIKRCSCDGFLQQDMIDAIQQLERTDFVKSMTTHADHRVWQDVYNTEFNDYLVYIKFQIDEAGHFVISFKEKSQ